MRAREAADRSVAPRAWPGRGGGRHPLGLLARLVGALVLLSPTLVGTHPRPAGAAQPSYSATVLADGPIGYWRLGDTGPTALDSAPPARHGTFGGNVTKGAAGALPADRDGAAGFDGTNAVVSVADGAALRLNGAFSIEFWAKQQAFVNRWPGILNKGESWTANGYLIWYDAEGRLRFKRDGRSVTTPTGALTPARFSHFVVTHDGTTTRWYVNGALASTSKLSYRDNLTTAPLLFGQGDNAGAVVLDEVALYDRALPAATIANHHAVGTAPPAITSPPGPPTSVTAIGGNTQAWVHWTPPTSPGSAPITTYTVTATPGGRSVSVAAPATDATVTGLANGTAYRFTVTAASDAGASPPSAASPSVTVSADPIIAAAGDIACSPEDPTFAGADPSVCQMGATAALIQRYRPAAVLPLGDTQYADGTAAEFAGGYAKTWGALSATSAVRPAVGNHEYGEYDGKPSRGAAPGYFGYFGAAANPTGATTSTGQPAGWYSYDVGTWHVVTLNTECTAVDGCSNASPQGRWLAADLAASAARCTVAAYHRPRWGDDPARDNATLDELWATLAGRGVDVALNGHKHAYQRFAVLDGTGQPSSQGVRQLVVGTGGKSLGSSAWGPQRPIEQVRDYSRFGVLLMTLHPGSYDWYFVGLDGAVLDQGTEACRDGTAPPPPPPPAPPASYADKVLADAPVAYWRLGDSGSTAVDASGQGRHGTYDPGVARGLAGALANSTDTAAGFDGSGASVVVRDGAALRLNGAFTIEFWAKRSAFVNRWPGVLGKGESWTANGYLIWYDAEGRLRFKRDGRTVATPSGALTDQYNHYAVSYDGTTVRWYVGGAQVAAAATTYPANGTSLDFVLGRGDEPGAVVLDEVALYDRALPAATVAAHHQAGR